MTIIVSFDSYTPVARYDNEPWTEALIEEAPAVTGTWTLIDTIALTPDVDPATPAARSFTTVNGTAADQWYRVTFQDGNGNLSLPTVPLENTSTSRVPYATTAELAAILHVTETAVTTPQLLRVLTASAAEIDSYLGRSAPFANAPDLVVEVNLERAVEHWQQMKSPFGVLGLGAESGPLLTATDSFNRHAAKLQPYVESWGVA